MSATENVKQSIEDFFSKPIRLNGELEDYENLTGKELAESFHYCIGINSKSVKNENEIAIGASKFRGLPHLPPIVEWPKDLYFNAQFNLKELAQYDVDNVLPSKGMLYVFTNEIETKVIYYDRNIEDLSITHNPFPSIENLPPYPRKKILDFLSKRKKKEFQKKVLEYNRKKNRINYFKKHYTTNPSSIEFAPYYLFYINDGDFYDYSAIAAIIPNKLKTEIKDIMGCEISKKDYVNKLFGRPIALQGEGDNFSDEYHFYTNNRKLTVDLKQKFLFLQEEPYESIIQYWIDKKDLKTKDFSKAFITFSGT